MPGPAVGLPLRSSAARQPAESAAVVDAGLWPAAAAGRSSVSAAVESFLGLPRGTERSLVAGLQGVLPETEQEKVARNEEVNKSLSQNHIPQRMNVSVTTKTGAEAKGKGR